MTAQKGKDLLLKLFDPAANAGAGDYVNVGGFRSNNFTINGENIDITSKDSNGFREILAGAGIRSISASGSGVFMSDDALKQVNAAVLSGAVENWQIIAPGMGTYEGPFALSSLEMSGEHNGEMTYTISLESAGAVTFTAA